MVVRFLVAVALLLGVVVAPGLWRARSHADAATVVSVAPVAPKQPSPEPPEFDGEAALASDDAPVALASAICMLRHGRRADVLRAQPDFATRLLKAIAARTLDRWHALAGAALIRLGDAARQAAFALSIDGTETERTVARLTLVLLNGDSIDNLASWRPLPRVEW